MEIAKSGSVGSLYLAGMTMPNTEDQQIVGKRSRGALHGLDEVGPGMKQERHHGHAQRASLGDAAWVEVWLPESPTNCVVEEAGGVEVGISVEGTRGEASHFKQTNEQPELDLIETFVYISAATADVFALQFGVFELKVNNIPRIFCTKGRSGPSIKGVSLPGLDPWRSAPQGRNTPNAVAD